jgi:hypothetical protein
MIVLHKDPEIRRAYHREYKRKLRDEIRNSPKLLAAYRRKNREQANKYRREHPDKVSEIARRTRIKKRIRDGKPPIGKCGPVPIPPEQRFWKYVVKTSGCWTWSGCVNEHGYGIIGGENSRDNVLAHRLSWMIHFGPIPDGLFVCHRCDNPPCVRPDHLFVGTNTDNIRDASAKGRMKHIPKQFCKRGHEFTSENTYVWRGHRQCRECGRINYRESRRNALNPN